MDAIKQTCARGLQLLGLVAASILSLGIAGHAGAADVFASAGADGVVRYSTQALDASYHLIYREPTPSYSIAVSTNGLGSGAPASPLLPIIERVARRHGLAPALVGAMVAVESNLNPQAVSPKGAQGPMQLMPATAARYGLIGSNVLRDPERNIEAGVRHLKDLLAQHSGNVALALAAYNAGAGAVARHRDRIPPYRETMLYVPAVLAKSTAAPAP